MAISYRNGQARIRTWKFSIKGLDADQRYFVRLYSENLAGTYWTGKETLINRIPIPDDLPGSLFLWFDANDLLAQNRTEYVADPEGTPVDQWKNKARSSDNESELDKDLSIPDASRESNNPKISHDGHGGIAVVEFDGNDWLQNGQTRFHHPSEIPVTQHWQYAAILPVLMAGLSHPRRRIVVIGTIGLWDFTVAKSGVIISMDG